MSSPLCSFYFFNVGKLFCKNVFIFGHAGSSLLFCSRGKRGLFSSCRVWASWCDGFSCWGAWALGHAGSVTVPSWLLGTGSIVAAYGPICSAACGIFLNQGLNPFLLHWQADSFFFFGRQILDHRTTREALFVL